MQIQSAFNAGMQGLQRASAGITEETLNINRQTQQNRQLEQTREQESTVQAAPENAPVTNRQTNAPDMTQSLVRLEQQELQAQANVRSIRTADEMVGSIIDVRV